MPVERAMGPYQNNMKNYGEHRLWAPGEENFFLA